MEKQDCGLLARLQVREGPVQFLIPEPFVGSVARRPGRGFLNPVVPVRKPVFPVLPAVVGYLEEPGEGENLDSPLKLPEYIQALIRLSCAMSSAMKESPPHRDSRNRLNDSCTSATRAMNSSLVIGRLFRLPVFFRFQFGGKLFPAYEADQSEGQAHTNEDSARNVET